MNLNCLILDDEPIAQEIIEGHLEHFDQLSLIAKCQSAMEASQILHAESIDLLFLDIEMPHLDGLSFLKNLDHPPKVIITTAYREYALEGHELNVVDYLLKPISLERFVKAVNRVLGNPAHQKQASKPYIYLKVDLKMVQVFLDEIKYIQGLSNYVRLFCEGRTLITYQKLSYLEEVLPQALFMRSHRSYIVNLTKIKSYTNQDLEIGDDVLPIGASHKKAILQALKQYEA